MALPAFEPNGNLPAGIHVADWAEIEARFGCNGARQVLLAGLLLAAQALAAAGCGRLYLDGSFVSDKDDPADYDGCWDVAGVDPTGLDPLLYQPHFLAWPRTEQKGKYKGDLFPAHYNAASGGPVFLDFFQLDHNGNRKGIVSLDLGGLP